MSRLGTTRAAAAAAGPELSTTMVQALADSAGVCQRPMLRRVTDRATGQTTTVPIPCGSTRASVCPACAEKARRLRMHQCREGWHTVNDPAARTRPATPEDLAGWDDDGGAFFPEPGAASRKNSGKGKGRRVRSTRRLEGFPQLPKADRTSPATIGRTYVDPKTGKTFRPSMFVTLTLDSYGRVHKGTGVPVDPARYDYRRAALDALHFARLVDRWWQNLRRATGWNVQYFAAVEPQRRLAPHLHAAIRGAIPRKTIKQVTAGTYAALWWPSIDEVRYCGDRLPVWDPAVRGYRDPDTGFLLASWDQALDELDDDPEAEPMHVASFGAQVDIKGIVGDSRETASAVSYLCKYVTKAITETYTDPDQPNAAYEAHIDRLHEETRWLPCSESCANWLRYGVTPKKPEPGLVPGMCPAKAHDRECLGLGGRRVLVSRHWTGKTLTEHKADRAAVVRAVLKEAGVDAVEADRLAADRLHTDGKPRFVWEDIPAHERDYTETIAASLRQRQAWKAQYDTAKQRLGIDHTGPPGGPVDTRSAIPIAS